MTLDLLLERVRERKVNVGIIGLGRVGLPLSTVFATKGLKVFGFDTNKERLELIRNAKCPFHDPPIQETLEKAMSLGSLKVEEKISKIHEVLDVIILTVGTPNTSDNTVDYSQLYSALDEIAETNLKNKMIILRSTMPPRTTEDIVIPFLENKSQLKAGIDFALAMCPERILEGHAIREIHELPEIIGGINETSNRIAAELFLLINPKKEMLYISPAGAELAKLFANIYRYISFALSNEFAIWAEIYGLDAAELIRISNYNYSRCNIPIPGFVGGPCLSKDGTFLDNNTTFASIVSTAWKLNESVPKHIVNNIKELIGGIFNKKIAVLGLSFKAGSDDIRQSPSVKLVELLKSYHANVRVHDPHVKYTLTSSEALDAAEIVIIATNHKEFRDLIPEITRSGCKLVYDVWSMFKDDDFPGIRYARFGRGFKPLTFQPPTTKLQ